MDTVSAALLLADHLPPGPVRIHHHLLFCTVVVETVEVDTSEATREVDELPNVVTVIRPVQDKVLAISSGGRINVFVYRYVPCVHDWHIETSLASVVQKHTVHCLAKARQPGDLQGEVT